ncbi:MAG: hypothetical protein M3Y83_14435 [Actinomycetota bacterium]|nr:hypothetical protein [Actinomycetota bacterium]
MPDAAQLSLLDELPDELSADLPEASVPATMHGHKANIDNGHLLIASAAGDWLFLNKGGRTIHCCLPGWSTAVELSAADLRVLGDYCHREASRIETR